MKNKIKFSLLPTKSSKELAKEGLVFVVVGFFLGKIFTNPILMIFIGSLCFYGSILLIVSFFYWIKETHKKHE